MSSILRTQGNTAGYFVVRQANGSNAADNIGATSNLLRANLFSLSNGIMYTVANVNPAGLNIPAAASNAVNGGLLLRDMGKTVIGNSNQTGTAADFRKVAVVNAALYSNSSNPSFYVCLGTNSSANGSATAATTPLPIVSRL